MTTQNNTQAVAVAFSIISVSGNMVTMTDGNERTSYIVGESFAKWIERLERKPSDENRTMFKTVQKTGWRCMQARKGETLSQKTSLRLNKQGELECILDEKSRLLVKPSVEMVNAWHSKRQMNAAKRSEKEQAVATKAKNAAEAIAAKAAAIFGTEAVESK